MNDKEFKELLKDKQKQILEAAKNGDENKYKRLENELLNMLHDDTITFPYKRKGDVWFVIHQATHASVDRLFNEEMKKVREEAERMTSEELTNALKDINPLFRNIFIEEQKKRDEEDRKQQEEKEKENNMYKERIELINFDVLTQIIVMSTKEATQNIKLENLVFNNKRFNIINDEQGLLITCSDGRKLKITIKLDKETIDYYDGDETIYETNLSITYSYLGKSICFKGLKRTSYGFDLTDEVLIKILTPYTSTNNMLSWNFNKNYKKIMFNLNELNFINDTLDSIVEEYEETEKESDEIKQMVLKLSPNDRKNLLNKLKENK